ncbi:helix-turn-helix domain-containing protein [Streptomyces sp. BH-SS-21]|uniref:Helix-turn-helix domain-containing protein n=1 Tax=Streptomyces liliiviolaceus TaxID=2823109 RepID=A0A940XVF3_9ACTN|nr:helix-turn-helix domain-containing protein [Streptomyces liliiviolaceus]MBQ0852619.1 helix-turn-helix domain-containing protein [Streptomyces liliiviolaceus]
MAEPYAEQHSGSSPAPYRERASRLTGAVVWTRAAEPGDAAPVLPDGCMDLLWTEGRLFVAGPDTRAYLSDEPGGPRRYAGVRFFPGTAPSYLGVPAHELRDRRVDLADLWDGGEVRRLTERVDAAADPAAALEAVAVGRAAGAGAPDPRLRAVVAALSAGAAVAATAEEVGWSERQLHRRALVAFGYGPKTLARVLRLQRALALVRGGGAAAEVAVVAGFADQAHLAREVRELAGAPLGELLRR